MRKFHSTIRTHPAKTPNILKRRIYFQIGTAGAGPGEHPAIGLDVFAHRFCQLVDILGF
jgi:hypothetical protein